MALELSSPVICFGELLWDEFKDERTAGGAPMNVAYHLSRLGTKAVLISCLGADEAGAQLRIKVRQMGIGDTCIQTDQLHPTGMVKVTQGADEEWQYQILEDAAWDHIGYAQEIEKLVDRETWLVYGSLAARNKDSASTLFRLLDVAGVKICDLNLRKPYYSRDLVLNLLSRANLVKLNEEELGMVSGWCGFSGNQPGLLQQLTGKFNWDCCLLTKGTTGSYLWDQDGYHYQPAFKVITVDTVGCGDAFLAGFLTKRLRGFPVFDQLEFGARMGALVASYRGACPMFDPGFLKD